MEPNAAITAIISTSPIYCHPSTEIIDETISQLRKHLPHIEICILADGVHPEQPHFSARYIEYLNRLHGQDPYQKRVTIYSARHWQHQSGMLQGALELQRIETPLVFWTEHDLPLRDEALPWQAMVDTLLAHEADVIRFKLNEQGKPPLEKEKIIKNDLPLLRTFQHTAWPQLIRVDFLKEFLASFGNDKTYFDDGTRDGYLLTHPQNKVYVYDPPPDSRRCYHNSGREKNLPSTAERNKPFVEVSGKPWHMNGPYKP